MVVCGCVSRGAPPDGVAARLNRDARSLRGSAFHLRMECCSPPSFLDCVRAIVFASGQFGGRTTKYLHLVGPP